MSNFKLQVYYISKCIYPHLISQLSFFLKKTGQGGHSQASKGDFPALIWKLYSSWLNLKDRKD